MMLRARIDVVATQGLCRLSWGNLESNVRCADPEIIDWPWELLGLRAQVDDREWIDSVVVGEDIVQREDMHMCDLVQGGLASPAYDVGRCALLLCDVISLRCCACGMARWAQVSCLMVNSCSAMRVIQEQQDSQVFQPISTSLLHILAVTAGKHAVQYML